MTAFSDILSRQASEIERPKPLPVGTYICQVKGLPRQDVSSKKGTPFWEFTLIPVGHLDDVTAEDLEAVGGLANKTLRATFYLTDEAEYRLADFLKALNIDVDRSYEEAVNDAPGQTVLAQVIHTSSNDGSTKYAEVKKYLKYGD